jgi:hypothetical protein
MIKIPLRKIIYHLSIRYQEYNKNFRSPVKINIQKTILFLKPS